MEAISYFLVKWLNYLTKLSVFLVFIPCIGLSQEIITVSDASGISYITGDVSENLARQNAIKEAKIDALKKAGISEYINSYQTLFSSQINNDFTQFFNSDIQTEIQGNVKSYTIKNEGKFLNPETKEIEYHVSVDAEVIKYETVPDITFDALIEGIKGAYNNNDDLCFTLKVTKDCYLTIFNISDKNTMLMYPNGIEKQQIFEKDHLYTFPLAASQLDYKLETTRDDKETNRLIFVFTKGPVPYVDFTDAGQITDIEKIFTWIYSIMPDQRHTEYFQFFIVK